MSTRYERDALKAQHRKGAKFVAFMVASRKPVYL